MRSLGRDARTSASQPPAGPLQWLTRFVQRIILLVIFGGIAFLALWFYAQHRVHEEIRKYFENRLVQHYAPQGLLAQVQSARLIEGQAIEIRGISIVEPKADGTMEPLATVDEVMIACDTRLHELISQLPRAQHVTIRGLKVRAVRGSEDNWNVATLWPLPRFGDHPPPLSIENATLEVAHSPGDPKRVCRLQNIHLAVSHETSSVVGQDVNSKASGPSETRIQGTLSNDHVERISFSSSLDVRSGVWSIHGLSKGLRVSPDLMSCLPHELADPLAMISDLRGLLEVEFYASYRPTGHPRLTFDITADLTHGQFENGHLPYPLTDIRAQIHCDHDQLRVDNLFARSGLGTLELSYRRDAWRSDSPFLVTAKAKQLVLDQRLAVLFPDHLRSEWEKFSPAGTVNLDATVEFDGRDWTPNLTIECLDVSFAYSQFPYRVRGCLGTITWTKQLCAVQLHGFVSDRIARIDAQLKDPGRHYTGSIDISLDGPITLNEELISSLKPKARSIVRSFHPRGMIKFRGHFTRKDPQQSGFDQQMTIELEECAVKYEKFPYPIEGITGTVEMINGEWAFRNLEGHNDSGRIDCDGHMTRQPDGSDQLELTFLGTSVPLEDELRDALNPTSQKIWNDLRPRGTVDSLTVVLRHNSMQRQVLLDVLARKGPQQQDNEGQPSISVHPTWFAYQMDDVTGQVRFQNGQVSLQNIRARHGNTQLSIHGNCAFSPNGWTVALSRLTANRLVPDHELISALPSGLGDAIKKLKLRGLLTLQGSLGIAGTPDPRRPVSSNWDLSFDIENGDIDCGLQLNHIRGSVKLVGQSNELGIQSRGDINVDSLIYRDVQFTKISGPLWIDDTQIRFGRWSQTNGVVPLSAQVFAGKLTADAVVQIRDASRWEVRAVVVDADLAQLARDVAPKMNKISGKAVTEVTLTGNKQGTHTWEGGGRIRLYDADIYEVPVMLALLKILSIRRPDKTAFTTSDMDFQIKGSDIYFDRIDFNGDAISLRGNGQINLNRKIDLNFYTIVGRNEFIVPLVSPLLGLASRQFLQIHVDGTLDNPNPPVRKVLPGLNESLRRLFPEIDSRDGSDRRASAPDQERMRLNNFLPNR